MYDLNPLSWNWNQAKAGGKHVISAIGGAVAMAVTFHLISADQASSITADIGLISDGVVKVCTGVAGLLGVLAPIYSAFRAAHNASPTMQAANLVKEVPGTVVVTTPEVAAAVPSAAVVSNTETKVVSK